MLFHIVDTRRASLRCERVGGPARRLLWGTFSHNTDICNLALKTHAKKEKEIKNR